MCAISLLQKFGCVAILNYVQIYSTQMSAYLHKLKKS